MRPVHTADTTHVLAGEPPVADLPVALSRVEDGLVAIVSTWALEPEERAAIALGANVRLTVWNVQVPVRLEVAFAPGVGEDDEDVRARLRRWADRVEAERLEADEQAPEGRRETGAPLEGLEGS